MASRPSSNLPFDTSEYSTLRAIPSLVPRVAMATSTKIGAFSAEDDYVKFRWEAFCCFAVYAKRSQICTLCPGDHAMVFRRLRCKSQTCDGHTDGQHSCPMRWKVLHCPITARWCVMSNGCQHNRGPLACEVPPRPVITPPMREYIIRQEENNVAPRNIWSAFIRA